ncbi:MAG TPA: hypothetical protein VFB06_11670 [Streptosporangiaceae bacterium]|nr:hypothetical protein [Streptosporangiaceae bacterium]
MSSRKEALGTRTGPLWPSPGIVLTQSEIDGRCTCTWVVTDYSKDGGSGSSLKYRDAMCPAARFHRSLALRQS